MVFSSGVFIIYKKWIGERKTMFTSKAQTSEHTIITRRGSQPDKLQMKGRNKLCPISLNNLRPISPEPQTVFFLLGTHACVHNCSMHLRYRDEATIHNNITTTSHTSTQIAWHLSILTHAQKCKKSVVWGSQKWPCYPTQTGFQCGLIPLLPPTILAQIKKLRRRIWH